VQEIAGLHPIRPVSARTIMTLPHLFEDLAAIRRRGYAIDDEEHAIGVRCGHRYQRNGESLGKIVQTVALKLSAQLGGPRSR